MAKARTLEVTCPCCNAELKLDVETGAVLTHKAPVRPPPIEDLASAVARLKAEPDRREQAFEKSFQEHKTHGQVLSKKFDELLKQAKENPDTPPPLRDIDLD